MHPHKPQANSLVTSKFKDDRKKDKNVDVEDLEKPAKKRGSLIQKDILLMDKEDLEKIGIVGRRLTLATLLKSRAYDIIMIILIIMYTLLIFVYFAFDCNYFEENPEDEKIFLIIEIVILGIFCVEIFLNIVAFHWWYLKDPWNFFDLVIIIISIIFVLLDVYVENNALKGFLKIRGIFRLLRIFILIRKLNALRVKREV